MFNILVKYFVDNFVKPLAGLVFRSLKDGIAVQISSPSGKKHIVGIKDEIFTEFKNSGYEDINDFFQIKLAELQEKQDSHAVVIKEEIFTKFKDSGCSDINDFLLASLNELDERRPPYSPEEYELDVPEQFKNTEYCNVFLQSVKQTCFNSGLSKDSAKRLFLETQKSLAEQNLGALKFKEQQNYDYQVEVNRLLVKRFKENLHDGIKRLNYIKKEFTEQINCLSPEELVNFVYELYEKEDKYNNCETSFLKSNVNSNNSEEFTEFQRIRTSEPFLNPNHPEHYKYCDRYLKLLEKI